MMQVEIARFIARGSSNRPSVHLWRAVGSKVRAFVKGGSAEEHCARDFPDDRVTPLLLRAASTQATLTDPAWAGPLAATSVLQAVEEVVSLSAIGRLMRSGSLHVDLGRYAAMTVPGRATTIADAGNWVGEGGVKPIRQFSVIGPTLRPRKLAVIAVFTRELSEASNIEDVIRTLVTEAAGPAIDAAIFSTFAGDATRSAGILNGVAPLAAGGTSGFDGCGADLGTLAGDLASRMGGANTIFVASPKQATMMRFFAGAQFAPEVSWVISSAGLPAGTVVALDALSFASTVVAPEFSVTDTAALHLDDAPAAGLLSGSPVKSMFQIDAIALKMEVFADWAMRAPHVAHMDSVSW